MNSPAYFERRACIGHPKTLRRPLSKGANSFSLIQRDIAVLSNKDADLVRKVACKYRVEFAEAVRGLHYLICEEELHSLIPLLRNRKLIEELVERKNSVELIRAGAMFLKSFERANDQLTTFEAWMQALTGPIDFWEEDRIEGFKQALWSVYEAANPLFYREADILPPCANKTQVKKPTTRRGEYLVAVAERLETLSEQGRNNLIALVNNREFAAYLMGGVDIEAAFNAGSARRITTHEARAVLGVLRTTKELADRLGSPGHFRDKIEFFGSRLPKYRKALLLFIAFILSAAKADKLKERTICGIGPIVEDAVSDLQVTRHGLQIVINLEAGNSLVACDRTALRFAVFNLILNSAEHKATVIMVNIRTVSAGLVQISIIDNGEGFDKSFRPKILEPGFTTKGKGHGHGTKVVDELTRKLGGWFDIGSPGLGQGCCADIFLPIVTD